MPKCMTKFRNAFCCRGFEPKHLKTQRQYACSVRQRDNYARSETERQYARSARQRDNMHAVQCETERQYARSVRHRDNMHAVRDR